MGRAFGPLGRVGSVGYVAWIGYVVRCSAVLSGPRRSGWKNAASAACCRCGCAHRRGLGAGERHRPRARLARAPRDADPAASCSTSSSIPERRLGQADIERNAQALTRMFERRRFRAGDDRRRAAIAGHSCRATASRMSRRTLTFYFHYDGQPVEPSRMDVRSLRSRRRSSSDHEPAGRTISLDDLAGRDRSGLAGLRPLGVRRQIADRRVSRRHRRARGVNIALTSNLRVIMEGDEEAGSPYLEAAMRDHGDQHRGRRAAARRRSPPCRAIGRRSFFGARGIMNALVTVYGPARDLHSGNYGNWAPNPALALARLLASMKDDARPRRRSTGSTMMWCR